MMHTSFNLASSEPWSNYAQFFTFQIFTLFKIILYVPKLFSLNITELAHVTNN